MAIVKMKKTTIIALQSEKEKLVKKLQEFGALHIIDLGAEITEGHWDELEADEENESTSQFESKLAQVKYCLEFLKRYDASRRSAFAPKVKIGEAQYCQYLDESQRVDEIFEECRAIDSKMTEYKSRETKIHNSIAQLTPWKSLDIAVEELKNTKNTGIHIGFVASKYAEEFKAALSISDNKIYSEEISSSKENTYMLLIYHNELEEAVGQLQKQFGWNRFTFGDYTGKPSEIIDELSQEIEELEVKKSGLQDLGKELIKEREYLDIQQDILSIERDKRHIVRHFGKTDKTFMLSAWIPENMADSLKLMISQVTDSFSIEFADPADEEEMPVLLENPSLAQPVEFITEQYSLPHPKGIDPNVIMAPFYICFFGMMVSDAAYGIILALVTVAILLKLKPEGNFKKIVSLICLGGISTFLWGAAFGGWLGDLIKIPPILFNPLEEPFKMIGLCLLFGVIHLYVGMGINAYKSIRSGKILDAVFDQGFWYALLTGLMLLALPATAVIGKYMAIVGAAGLVLTQGRHQKNIVMRFFSGVLSLYNVTGFLGDILSYLRLFALGLATGVIGAVINSMSLMLGGSIIGYILMVFFMILGHSFNIAINVLGAYVHSSRLQYVEFFGKFYDGDGKPFNPFKIATKYIEKSN